MFQTLGNEFVTFFFDPKYIASVVLAERQKVLLHANRLTIINKL